MACCWELSTEGLSPQVAAAIRRAYQMFRQLMVAQRMGRRSLELRLGFAAEGQHSVVG